MENSNRVINKCEKLLNCFNLHFYILCHPFTAPKRSLLCFQWKVIGEGERFNSSSMRDLQPHSVELLQLHYYCTTLKPREKKNAAISKQKNPCTRKCWLALISPLLLVLPAIRLNHKKFLTHITLLINLRALLRHKRNASKSLNERSDFEINGVWVTHSSAS